MISSMRYKVFYPLDEIISRSESSIRAPPNAPTPPKKLTMSRCTCSTLPSFESIYGVPRN